MTGNFLDIHIVQLFGIYRVCHLKESQNEMAVALKHCMFDPMLVKPKCVWEAVVFSFFKNLLTFLSCLLTIFQNELPTLKRILAWSTYGQICTVSALLPFLSDFFPNWTSWQSDPNQNLPIQMAITLQICFSDPILMKPKCVWEPYICLNFCQLFVYNFESECVHLKRILALQTWRLEMPIFRVTATWNGKFWFGSPCIKCQSFWEPKIHLN